MVKTALAMRMTGITTGVGLPHNIGHSNAWRNYSVTEVNEYKSRQYGSKGNKYRFSVSSVSGNLLIYEPNKGQSFAIAKIRISTFDDGVDRYYLEWLPTSKRLSKEQRDNAERWIERNNTQAEISCIVTEMRNREPDPEFIEMGKNSRKILLEDAKKARKRMEFIKQNRKKK